MAAVWPTVQARLVALLPTLAGYTDVVVYDGPALTEKGAKSYVTVGHSRDGDSGSYEQPDSAITGLREESGTVVCEFVVWTGDTSLPTVRASAFALVDALEAAIRADQRLGVLSEGSTVTLAADVVSAQDSSGAVQRLVVSVQYFTRT